MMIQPSNAIEYKHSPYKAVTIESPAELHIFKNDGRNTHEVYTCRDVRVCYNLWKAKWYKDQTINGCSKAMIIRNGRVAMRLKY